MEVISEFWQPGGYKDIVNWIDGMIAIAIITVEKNPADEDAQKPRLTRCPILETYPYNRHS